MALRYGTNPFELAEAGWAVVWAPGLDPQVRRALDPLCDRRREQAGTLYRELLYRPGEDVVTFLSRHQAPLSLVDPERLPYYVLLVGSPEEIPFSFQVKLDQQYAVGRLHFDQPQGYAAYARGVLRAEETGGDKRRKKIAFFAPEYAAHPASHYVCHDLVEPLADLIEQARPDWRVRHILREDANPSTSTSEEPPSGLNS